jgi:uroporphyrinogen III methyltransferase/synthase
LLQDQGAEVIALPLLETKPLKLSLRDAEDLAEPWRFNYLVFSSPEAVRVYCEFLWERGKDARILGRCQIAVVGPGTAQELKSYGLRPDFQAKKHFRAQGLVSFLPPLQGRRVLLPRALKAREVLVQELEKAGARVRAISMYETVLPASSRASGPRLRAMIAEGRLSAVTFTSSSSVTHLLKVLGPRTKELLKKVAKISIGPSTSATLREAGLKVNGEASESSVEELSKAVSRVLRSGK